MATVELSTGDMLAGSARLVDGLERLLLLTFGITMGAQLAGLTPPTSQGRSALGAWAPWLGVLIFGAGQYVASSAPRRTLGWLLIVLNTPIACRRSRDACWAPWAPVSSQPQWSCRCATRSRAAEVGRPCRSPSSPPSGCWCPGLSGSPASRRSWVRTRRPASATSSAHSCRSSRSPWASSSARGVGADRTVHVDLERDLAVTSTRGTSG